jgi:hypothetical protein
MNTNINDLFALTGYERDTSKLLAMNTQTPSNAGFTLEMEALGFGGEVLDVAVRPSVGAVQVDLTDWDRIIK